MLSEQEILRLIRDRVDHPATAKELVQILGVHRDERATFKRHLRALVRSGALSSALRGVGGPALWIAA